VTRSFDNAKTPRIFIRPSWGRGTGDSGGGDLAHRSSGSRLSQLLALALQRRVLTFAALSLLFFLVSAGTFSSLGVVLPAMVHEMGWSWTQAGMGYTFLGLACGLASFAPAILIRRLGVRFTLLGGTVLLVLGFGALAQTHTAALYLAATLVIGVAFSLTTTVPGTHVLTGLFKRRSSVLGGYFTIGALGQVAGPLLYVAIEGPSHNWRIYWWVFVGASTVLGGFAAFVCKDAKAGAEPVPTLDAPPEQTGPAEMIQGLKDWTVRRALATPQFYVIVGAYTMYLLINTTAHGFAVEHLTERGVAPKAAAGMLSLEALIGALMAVVGGVVGERVGPKRLLIASLAALVCGMVGLAYARGYGLMLVYAVGVGIGYGLSFLASTMLLLDYFGKRANLELYSIMCLISTSAAIGPAVGGWARDTLGSFTGMFLLCALATFAMFIATLFLAPAKARPVAADLEGGLGPRPVADGAR
jgi:MFS family permease